MQGGQPRVPVEDYDDLEAALGRLEATADSLDARLAFGSTGGSDRAEGTGTA